MTALHYPALSTGLLIAAPSALGTRALSMAAQEKSIHEFRIPVRRPSFPTYLVIPTKRSVPSDSGRRERGGISKRFIWTNLP